MDRKDTTLATNSSKHNSASEETLTGPSLLAETVHHAVNNILTRVPSILSLASENTVVDTYATPVIAKSAASATNHPSSGQTSTGFPRSTVEENAREYAGWVFCWLFTIGVPHAVNNACNSVLGYVILRLTRPDDAGFDISIVSATLTGLVGGVTFHATCIFVLVSLLCILHASSPSEPEPNHPGTPPAPASPIPSLPGLRDPTSPTQPSPLHAMDREMEQRANSPLRTQLWGIWPIWLGIPLCMARATAVGALGAALLKHSSLLPMDVRHAAVTNVVGTAVLYVPRGAMAVVWRLVLVREYRAFQARRRTWRIPERRAAILLPW